MRRLLGPCAAALLGCGAPPAPQCGLSGGEVTDVVDGDTVTLAGGHKVRYLLVDTPEVTQGKNDCYGVQARDFNRSLVLNKEVKLTFDGDCKDRFGRYLAYVSVGGTDVNRALIEGGYACVLYIAPSGASRRAELEDLELGAKTDRRGLWGACTTSPCQ